MQPGAYHPAAQSASAHEAAEVAEPVECLPQRSGLDDLTLLKSQSQLAE